MSVFTSFVPQKSNKLLECWVNELNINVKVTNPRRTKLGDFKVIDNHMNITINTNMGVSMLYPFFVL